MMMFVSDYKQADIIDALNTTSTYLQSSNLVKSIPLTPKPRFKTCIYLCFYKKL